MKTTHPTCLISIHDVSPHTLPKVTNIVNKLKKMGIYSVTLLVIPWLDWTESDINHLKKMQHNGYPLAGHGNTHGCKPVKNNAHRLHSLVISRNVAEHLSCNRDEVKRIITTCYHWFTTNDFDAPDLYVPPAWAMGDIAVRDLHGLPFRYYESLTGIYDTKTGSFRYMPLLGFEADTPLRKFLVRSLNCLNWHYGMQFNKTIRVSIHPNDFDLLLARDLERVLTRFSAFLF